MRATRAAALVCGWLIAVGAACEGDTAGSGAPATGEAAACSIAVVNTDFASTSVSLLHSDGRLCLDDVINSGSQPIGVVTALSGDVSVPSAPAADGRLLLIDRFPNAVLTFAALSDDSGALAVEQQVAVADATPTNPYDVAFISADLAYVSRFDANDLLAIDPSTGAQRYRVDLALEADPGLLPRPARMVVAGGLVWVALGHLSRDFTQGGPGRLIAVDPATDTVAWRITLPDFANCTGVAATPAQDGLWVACMGVFDDGAAGQLARSGVLYIGIAGAAADTAPQVVWNGVAKGQPFSDILAPFDSERVYVVSSGSAGDRLLLVDRTASTAANLGVEAGPFELRGLLASRDAGVLLVSNANPRAPSVMRLALDGRAPPTMLAPVNTNPRVGLPPGPLGVFRQLARP